MKLSCYVMLLEAWLSRHLPACSLAAFVTGVIWILDAWALTAFLGGPDTAFDHDKGKVEMVKFLGRRI